MGPGPIHLLQKKAGTSKSIPGLVAKRVLLVRLNPPPTYLLPPWNAVVSPVSSFFSLAVEDWHISWAGFFLCYASADSPPKLEPLKKSGGKTKIQCFNLVFALFMFSGLGWYLCSWKGKTWEKLGMGYLSFSKFNQISCLSLHQCGFTLCYLVGLYINQWMWSM